MDVYADNRGIIADGVPEIEEYMKEVLPDFEEIERFKKELLEACFASIWKNPLMNKKSSVTGFVMEVS